MRRITGAVVVAILAVVASTVGALSAASVPTDTVGRISAIKTEQGTISLVFTGVNLPEGTAIEPDTVTVALDGEQIESTATPITEAAEPPSRTVVLTVDTSGSMADDGKIDAAKQAALSYLDQVPADVLVGLVSFSDAATVTVAPTTDREAVRAAVNSLQASGDTALYDAVVLAAQSTGTEGIRSVLVLSDGEDTASATDVATAVDTVTQTGVKADAVALGAGAEGALSALTQITAATGGVVVQAAGASQLGTFFAAAAETLTNELAVVAEVPADFEATSATLDVSGQAGDQTLAASAFITVVPGGQTEAQPEPPAAYGPVAVPPAQSILPAGWSDWLLPVAIGAVALGVAGVLAFAFLAVTRDKSGGVRGRLSIYTLGGARPRKEEERTSTALGQSAVARSAVELADRMVKERDYEDDLAQRLDAAGLPLRSAEWVLIQAGLAIGLGLLLLLVSGFNVVLAVVGLGLGIAGPYLYLRIKAGRRRDRFVSQLPDTLMLMAGSMEAGYSLPQAVDTVVREGVDPISSEFNRALIESRLGVPIEDALESVAERMQSQDFDWVVMAIRIQRQVGGSLADVLKTVAETLRERERLRRMVRALSADGRLSAWIISLAPFFVAAFLILFRPEYVAPLFQQTIGWIMIGFALVLIAIGVFIISRIIKVEL